VAVTGAEPYPSAFYAARARGSRRSAEVVLDLLAGLGCGPWSRVLDVGCGRGDWLRACIDRGTGTAIGIDGPWNEAAFLPSDPVRFRACDLSTASPGELASLAAGPRFDLAISVEALEHVPADAGARVVELLVDRADVVLFSAAIPGQGGRGHCNEQWPSTWASQFAAFGYRPYDVVRPRLWSCTEVEPWYRQNLLLFAAHPPGPGLRPTSPDILDLVHPEIFESRRRELSWRELGRAARNRVRRRMRDLRRRLGA
jgi:SAM-dependent methyltransferase